MTTVTIDLGNANNDETPVYTGDKVVFRNVTNGLIDFVLPARPNTPFFSVTIPTGGASEEYTVSANAHGRFDYTWSNIDAQGAPLAPRTGRIDVS